MCVSLRALNYCFFYRINRSRFFQHGHTHTYLNFNAVAAKYGDFLRSDETTTSAPPLKPANDTSSEKPIVIQSAPIYAPIEDKEDFTPLSITTSPSAFQNGTGINNTAIERETQPKLMGWTLFSRTHISEKPLFVVLAWMALVLVICLLLVQVGSITYVLRWIMIIFF